VAINIYKSTDASAPVLTGQVGSLTAVLLACLVNGYGAKAAAGWTNPFSGTNQRIFRPGSGVQHYFGVDDNASGTGGAKEASVTGWETATAWATNVTPGSNTGPFPTNAQNTLGVTMRKSTTADATARAWTVVADARTCYVFMQSGDSAGLYLGAVFGEFYSLLATTDLYRSIVIGRPTPNIGTISATTEMVPVLATGGNTAMAGHYMPRSYAGLGSSIACRKWGDSARANASGSNYFMGSQGLSLPEPVTGAIHVAPIHLSELNFDVRGRMRGLFHCCHNGAAAAPTGFTDGATVVGSGAYVGRTFYVVSSPTQYVYFFDMTGPWETN
jgi:hypothetical protein